ncbi:MAG TPA: hypothetical protein VE972_02515 [Conexibacter sp.]|nr:hypothetical protein [Conexibacter sp.]
MAWRGRATIWLAAVCGAAFASAPVAATAAVSGDSALAQRFRPRLLFDAKERWRPLDVERFLAEPGHAACPAPGAGACAPLTSLAQLTPAIAYLDLRGTRGDGSDATAPELATCAKSDPSLRDCDEDGRSVIYAHVVRARARVAIDYWWFLRYNAFTLDRHEGDWEGVTVIVDRLGTRVLDVHFAAHADVWRYDASVPRIVGNRVKVYVARGDHAAYPRPCRSFCRETGGTLPEAHFGGERSWVGNSAAGCRRRCVRLMPTDAAGAPASWDAWDGRWGVPRSKVFAPPLTPAFQRRYLHPFAASHSGRHLF